MQIKKCIIIDIKNKCMKLAILLIFFFSFSINQSLSLKYPIQPRYVSLKKEKVYMRYNASFEAPRSYIYLKKHLPVLVIDENENWRKIRDVDGIEGWIHKSMLSSKKTFINQKKQNLFRYLENKSLIIAIVEKDVVGRILLCKEDFCKVKIRNYKGWIEKKFLWGIKKD